MRHNFVLKEASTLSMRHTAKQGLPQNCNKGAGQVAARHWYKTDKEHAEGKVQTTGKAMHP